jgi:hypothetical protein
MFLRGMLECMRLPACRAAIYPAPLLWYMAQCLHQWERRRQPRLGLYNGFQAGRTDLRLTTGHCLDRMVTAVRPQKPVGEHHTDWDVDRCYMDDFEEVLLATAGGPPHSRHTGTAAAEEQDAGQ